MKRPSEDSVIARKRVCYSTPAERVLTNRGLLMLIMSFVPGKRLCEWRSADLAAKHGYLYVLQRAPKMKAFDPLSEAVSSGHVEVAKYLLSAGYRFTAEQMVDTFSRGDTAMLALILESGVCPKNAFLHAARHQDEETAHKLVSMLLSRAVRPSAVELDWAKRVKIEMGRMQSRPADVNFTRFKSHPLEPAMTMHNQYVIGSEELARRNFVCEFTMLIKRGLFYHSGAIFTAAKHGSAGVFAILTVNRRLCRISDEALRMTLLNNALQGGNPDIISAIVTEFSELLIMHYDRIRLIIPKVPASGLYALIQGGMVVCEEMAQVAVREADELLLMFLYALDPLCVQRDLSIFLHGSVHARIVPILRSWGVLDENLVCRNMLSLQNLDLLDALVVGQSAEYKQAIMNSCYVLRNFIRIEVMRHLHLKYGVAYPSAVWPESLRYLRDGIWNFTSYYRSAADAISLLIADGWRAPRMTFDNEKLLCASLERERAWENKQTKPHEHRLKNISNALAKFDKRRGKKSTR